MIQGYLGKFQRLSRNSLSECRRARDAKRDIPVPLSPCARATTCTCRGRPAPGPRLRHFAPPPDPYDEWLDGVSDALASGLRQLRDLRPLRHFGQPLAPTPTADYPPRASRFPGGQRRNSLTVGSLKKINNLFIKDIFHGYCLKRQSLSHVGQGQSRSADAGDHSGKQRCRTLTTDGLQQRDQTTV